MAFSLRRLESKDAPFMLEWMHDENVNYVFSTPFASFTLEQVEAFIENANKEDPNNLHFACVDENDEYMGTVSLKNIQRMNRNAEYAISFRSCAHGTGASMYATEEILRIAFDVLKLERVYLYLLSINQRANRFYRKVGFIHEGTLRNHVMHNGKLYDEIWYGILKEEWTTRR